MGVAAARPLSHELWVIPLQKGRDKLYYSAWEKPQLLLGMGHTKELQVRKSGMRREIMMAW